MRHQEIPSPKATIHAAFGLFACISDFSDLLKKCANSGTFSVKFKILVSIRLANHRAKPVLVRLSRNGLGGATVAVIEIIATIRASMRIDFLKNLQEVSVFCLFRLCKFFLTWEYLDMAYITKTSAGTWRAEVRSVEPGPQTGQAGSHLRYQTRGAGLG